MPTERGSNLREALGVYSGRRVLVTGHTGFKGSWLSLWLTELGAQVTGFSDSIPTQPSHFETLGIPMDDRRGDILDSRAIREAMESAEPDIVFHFAAQSLVRRAYADPIGTYRTNVLGTLKVMEAARSAGIPAFVSATTDKVYRNDESGRRYREDDEIGGRDPYSASKACIEIMTSSYRETVGPGMRIATVRAGNVIGGGDWAEDRLIPDLMRAAFSSQTAVVRNPQSTRPWQHVLDVLAGYLLIGNRLLEGESGEAWNLGPIEGAGVCVADIIAATKQRLPELGVEIQPDTSGRHESNFLQLDSSKAMDRLAWRPRWESAMLDRTLDWYRAFYQQKRIISAAQIEEYQG